MTAYRPGTVSVTLEVVSIRSVSSPSTSSVQVAPASSWAPPTGIDTNGGGLTISWGGRSTDMLILRM